MAEQPTAVQLKQALSRGDFDSLIGVSEDDQLEAKMSPYRLSFDERNKHELAKDVSALANSRGGIIVIGFRTKKDDLTAREEIDESRPFDLQLVNPDQYRKVLEEWIYPPIHAVSIESYPSPADKTRGVAAIYVPISATKGGPFIVTRTVEPDGSVRGNLFGYYERVSDRIPATSSEMLCGHIRDGMRFGEVMERLANIESLIGNEIDARQAPQDTGLTDEDIHRRVTESLKAVDRSKLPSIVLAVTSTNATSFPDVFHAQSKLVNLLEHAPVLRENGFHIRINKQTEVVDGKLRRNVARGYKLIDLWRDGLLVAVGPGDADLLCWWGGRREANGTPIRNFVLAEVTLDFINFALAVFSHSQPVPISLKFWIVLSNMTASGGECTLSSVPDNTPGPHFSMGRERNAPNGTIESEASIPYNGIDAGDVAYRLLGELYVQFGFNYDDMPYVEQGGRRITAGSLLGGMSLE